MCGSSDLDVPTSHREVPHRIAVDQCKLNEEIKDVWDSLTPFPSNFSFSTSAAIHFIRSVEYWSPSFTTVTPWKFSDRVIMAKQHVHVLGICSTLLHHLAESLDHPLSSRAGSWSQSAFSPGKYTEKWQFTELWLVRYLGSQGVQMHRRGGWHLHQHNSATCSCSIGCSKALHRKVGSELSERSPVLECRPTLAWRMGLTSEIFCGEENPWMPNATNGLPIGLKFKPMTQCTNLSECCPAAWTNQPSYKYLKLKPRIY